MWPQIATSRENPTERQWVAVLRSQIAILENLAGRIAIEVPDLEPHKV
jgi:hypothetical protein